MKKALGVAVLSALLLSGNVIAENEAWSYYHRTVDLDGESLIRYSKISQPASGESRMLVEDDQGHHWVVRASKPPGGTEGEGVLNFKFVATGETLEIEIVPDDHVTYSIGSVDVTRTYLEDAANEGVPAAVQTAAQAMLASTSQDFQDSLENLASVAHRYSASLYWIGPVLSEVFFPAMVSQSPTGGDSPMLGFVGDFDPNVTPPGSFELQFGPDYFQ